VRSHGGRALSSADAGVGGPGLPRAPPYEQRPCSPHPTTSLATRSRCRAGTSSLRPRRPRRRLSRTWVGSSARPPSARRARRLTTTAGTGDAQRKRALAESLGSPLSPPRPSQPSRSSRSRRAAPTTRCIRHRHGGRRKRHRPPTEVSSRGSLVRQRAARLVRGARNARVPAGTTGLPMRRPVARGRVGTHRHDRRPRPPYRALSPSARHRPSGRRVSRPIPHPSSCDPGGS